MLPLLGGAMAACTYHLFYNPPELDILVALQVCTNSYLCRLRVPAALVIAAEVLLKHVACTSVDGWHLVDMEH